MKYTSEVIQGIISTPPEYAFLQKIENDICVYSINYKANPFLCLKYNALLVTVHISTKPYTSNTETVFNQSNASSNTAAKTENNTEEVLNKLLKRNTVIKQNINNNKAEYLVSIKSDISVFIPNDAIKSITKGSSTSFIKTTRTFNNVSIDSIRSNGNSPVILGLSKPSLIGQYNVGNSSAPELSVNLLLNKGIDPASLVKKYALFDYAPTVYAGVSKQTNLGQDITLSSIASALFQKNINQNLQRIEELSAAGSSYIPIPTKTSVNEVEGNVIVKLPVDLGTASTFWVIYEITDRDGNILERLVRSVDHSKMVSLFSTPRKLPTINVKNLKSINSLEIRQEDDLAVGVQIYKKIIPTAKANITAAYSLIADFALTKKEGFKNFKDPNIGLNTVVYRVVSYGRGGTLSSNFNSCVVSNSKKLKLSNNKNSFCALSHEISPDGIKIKIGHLPPDPIGIQLIRKDIASKLKDIIVNDTNYMLGLSRNGQFEILDTTGKPNRVYQYRVKFLYKDGTSFYSSSVMSVENILPVEQVINTIIKNIKTITNGSFIDCTFELQTSFVEKEEQLLRNALEKAGALSYFGGDVNKEKLQYATVYQIIRTNLTTGETEDLGITTKTAFTDSAFSSVSSAKSLQPDNEYEYKVLTYFRAPDTILKNTVNEVKKRTSLDSQGILVETLDYSFEPFKWKHPENLKKGTLVSPNSLKRNHSKNDFTFGDIGSVAIGLISFKFELPTITSVNSFVFAKNKIKILWKISGEVSKIDHFIIYNQSVFGKNIVGKANNITANNSFEFIDELNNGEVGSLTYSVLPVYYDYNLGKEISSNTVVI